MRGDRDQLPSGEDVLVRPADLDDAAALAALATRFRSDGLGTDGRAAERASYLALTRSPAYFRRVLGEHLILVAVAEDRLVGYAHFGAVSGPEVRADSADRSLHRLHVATSLQGRGIGRRLMVTALSGPELADAPRIFLRVSEHNERALTLYSHLGFHRAGASHFRSAAPGGDLVMVLDRRQHAG